jgi:hypothetical protein
VTSPFRSLNRSRFFRIRSDDMVVAAPGRFGEWSRVGRACVERGQSQPCGECCK